jgi:hypothetical protein
MADSGESPGLLAPLFGPLNAFSKLLGRVNTSRFLNGPMPVSADDALLAQ